MELDSIRKAFRTTPFRPLDVITDNGNRHRCPSPEAVITPALVVVVDESGDPVLLAPEAINEIAVAKPRGGKAGRPAPKAR